MDQEEKDRIKAALGLGKNVLGSMRASFQMEASIRDALQDDVPLTPEQGEYIDKVEAS